MKGFPVLVLEGYYPPVCLRSLEISLLGNSDSGRVELILWSAKKRLPSLRFSTENENETELALCIILKKTSQV